MLDGLLFTLAIAAAVLLAAALPHHACDTLTPLPWLRC